jgi:hypothetical protein
MNTRAILHLPYRAARTPLAIPQHHSHHRDAVNALLTERL